MEGSVQNKERRWDTRRQAKQLKLAMVSQYADGAIIQSKDIVKVLEMQLKLLIFVLINNIKK